MNESQQNEILMVSDLEQNIKINEDNINKVLNKLNKTNYIKELDNERMGSDSRKY